MKLYALRKPLKPLLCALLLALIATATLVFSLQTLLDGLLLENAAKEYAYAVTPYGVDTAAPMLDPVDDAVVRRLSSSDRVSAVQVQGIRAGRLLDASTVPDCMMTMDALNQHYFLEVTVKRAMPSRDLGAVSYDTYVLTLESSWGLGYFYRDTVTLDYRRLTDEPMLAAGTRLFLVCDYVLDRGAVTNERVEYITPALRQAMGQQVEGDPLRTDGCFVIPDSLVVRDVLGKTDREKTLANTRPYILEQMERSGLLPLFRTHQQLENAVTVREVSDMGLVPYFATGKLYVDWGRQLYETDRGQKVCMVSQGLMLRNRLTIGDTVTLALADGAYTVGREHAAAGWESGFPMVGEDPLQYGAGEKYTVVGVYHQQGRDTGDPFYCSLNDIFIPVRDDGPGGTARPYKLTFQIPGDRFDGFLAENEAWLQEAGYRLQVVDNGWEDVADAFYAMYDRRVLTLVCAALCFLAGGLSFGGLIYHQYSREYGLCRLLGAYRREALRVCLGGFALSAVPGALTAVAASWAVYGRWLRQAVFEAAPLTMPTDGQCLGLLMLWTLGQLLLSGLVMLLLILRSEKKSVLRML